jgi:hypothetical protein
MTQRLVCRATSCTMDLCDNWRRILLSTMLMNTSRGAVLLCGLGSLIESVCLEVVKQSLRFMEFESIE